MIAVYISSNQFSVSTDKTIEFVPGRRLKLDQGVDGIAYSTISGSTYSTPNTIVTTKESELTSNLVSVLYGVVESGSEGSLPDHVHDGSEGSGGIILYNYVISEDTTLYVSTTGDDIIGDGSLSTPYATPHKALDYLKNKWINGDAVVTIQCGDGSYVLTETISPNHPCGDRIKLIGENVYSKSLTSIQSSSGSAGAWSLVLNLNNVTSIESGDFVIIHTPSGGTRPYHVCGCHEVTNVDAVNSRITIASGHQGSIAPSGAISATVIIVKTIFQMAAGEHGLYIDQNNKLGGLGNIVFDGGGSTGYGIYITDFSFLKILAATYVGTYDTNLGMFSDNNSVIKAEGLVACSKQGASHAIMADDKSTIICPNAIASGVSASGKYGFYSVYNSHIEATGAVSTGGVSIGILASIRGMIRAVNAIADEHTTGFYCSRGAYIYAPGAAAYNCSTDFNPAVNTQDNEFGYIDT